MHKLLIDECLSQSLVAASKSRGVHADHVVWIGKGGMQDWTLIPFAVEQDYLFVTNNRRDFMKAYACIPLHAGLIIIVPMVPRAEQLRLLNLVLDAVALLQDTINTLIEITADGTVSIRPWSSDGHEPATADGST